MKKEKQLYIIAGCNGAGKTTASYTVLPEILDCQEFVNADEIARGLSPFNPESMTIQAGRLLMKRIDELLAVGASFAVETTLSPRTYKSLVLRAQKMGYKCSLLFFWLESPEMAVMRVAKRVEAGGHNVPSDVVKRRYRLGLEHLFDLYMPCVDYWMLFDNSCLSRVLVAEGGKDMGTIIHDVEIYEHIESYVRRRS
ncbi:MAG: zeta toxin family protein [Bacteroidales bacterium]|nr:zeta toxin family protein [Bacteroidales bacterium]